MLELIKKSAKSVAKRGVLPLVESGVSREVSVAKAPAFSRDAWLVAQAPTVQELDRLSQIFALDRDNLSDVLDLNESPRLDNNAKFSYLYVRGAHSHADGSPTTRPILLIFGGTNLITLFAKKSDFLEDLLLNETFSTESPQAILLKVLANLVEDYDQYIKTQSRDVKDFIAKMRMRKLKQEDFLHFVVIEDQINIFLAAPTPLEPLLKRVATSANLTLSEREKDQFEDIELATEQAINLCKMNAARIVSIREAYATLSNNSLNQTMRTLTLATLTFAAPNLIFSMYGMNVGLPFMHEIWGYSFALFLAVILIIFVIFWARRRRLF